MLPPAMDITEAQLEWLMASFLLFALVVIFSYFHAPIALFPLTIGRVDERLALAAANDFDRGAGNANFDQ